MFRENEFYPDFAAFAGMGAAGPGNVKTGQGQAIPPAAYIPGPSPVIPCPGSGSNTGKASPTMWQRTLAPGIAALTAAALLGLTGWGYAFPQPTDDSSPRLYLCSPAASAPAIDGSLDEAAWAAAPWSEPFVDIRGMPPERAGRDGAFAAPALQTRVKMLWDRECFYVAAYLQEPHVWATLDRRDAVIYHDNDFEVFIDPDGDNHLYYELEINALNTVWDLLLIRPYRDGGPAVDAWDIQGLRTGVAVRGTLNDPRDVDDGWSVEIAVPWAVLAQCAGRPAPPASGDIWRVNFSRVQWTVDAAGGATVKRTDPATGRPLPEDNWVWSPQGLVAMHYPERWGQVMFVDGPGPESCAATFAASPEHRSIAAAQGLMTIYYRQREFQERHGRFASRQELAQSAAGLPESVMASGREFSLTAAGDVFRARLIGPEGTCTVNETGRLVRAPLEGIPAGGAESELDR